jgi:hypothetical protein
VKISGLFSHNPTFTVGELAESSAETAKLEKEMESNSKHKSRIRYLFIPLSFFILLSSVGYPSSAETGQDSNPRLRIFPWRIR